MDETLPPEGQSGRSHARDKNHPLAPRGEYGIDAPLWPLMLGSASAVLTASAIVMRTRSWAVVPMLAGLGLGLQTASYLYTTRSGKFAVWAELLEGLDLRGDERVLDMGCGRGAVLLLAAKLLPRGRAVGLDLWATRDQSGNAIEATLGNAALEGVSERVELHTGDMRSLPFEDASFDVVLSSLAIHNIADPVGRAEAVGQAVRVLKPGGRLLIADFRWTKNYAVTLHAYGLRNVQERDLGWRFWYGGPWTGTNLVSATKP